MGRLITRTSIAAGGGGGALIQGSGWRITGSGWGTNVPAANQISPWAEIEGQANNTALTTGILGSGWSKPGSDQQLISTAATWNSTRSILNDNRAGLFQFGFQRDLSSAYLALRADIFVYLNAFNTNGQLKTVRYGGPAPGAGIVDFDGGGECFFQHFPSNEVDDSGFPCNVVRQNSNGSANSNFTTTQAGARMIQRGQWTRMQHGLIPGTANTSDGTVTVHARRMDTGAVIGDTSRTSQLLRGTGDPAYQRITPQFYMGNGYQVANGASAEPYTYIDGRMYWIVNYATATLPYTVEFTNASTYGSSTEFVTQFFTSWTDGQIDGTYYQGRLPGNTPGTNLWAYVMTAPGVPASSTGIVPVAI
jgi:hypothetical protein